MVRHVDEIAEGMRMMRIRNAILINILLKHQEPLVLTPLDIFNAANHDVHVETVPEGLKVTLKPSPKS